MPIASSKPRLTSLLANRALSRLERLRINATRRFTDKRRGEHLTGRGGMSTEFSDYRDYVPGDDVRFLDWNAFMRLRRPYIKLYHQEEEMHVVIVVDASASMLFDDKLLRAKQLAAAFGVMGLFGNERVSVYAFNTADATPARLRPCVGRSSMLGLFEFLEDVEGGGDAPFEAGVELVLKRHVGRGVAVLLSDFLSFGDLKRPFNRLFSAGLELFAVQILGPSEVDPDVGGDTRFVDSETHNTLDVSCNADLLSLYHEYRLSHERALALLCQQRAGRFVSTSSSDQFDWVVFDLLRRKGWVR